MTATVHSSRSVLQSSLNLGYINTYMSKILFILLQLHNATDFDVQVTVHRDKLLK